MPLWKSRALTQIRDATKGLFFGFFGSGKDSTRRKRPSGRDIRGLEEPLSLPLIRPHGGGRFAAADADVLQMANSCGLFASRAPGFGLCDFVHRKGMDALPSAVRRIVNLPDANHFDTQFFGQNVEAQVGEEVVLHRAAAWRGIAAGPDQMV